MMYFNVVLLDLRNSDIAAVSFEGTKTKRKGLLDPSDLKFAGEEYEYFVLVWETGV